MMRHLHRSASLHLSTAFFALLQTEPALLSRSLHNRSYTLVVTSPVRTSFPPIARMPADLTETSMEDLLAEFQRRLSCLEKPEKRIILVGAPPQALGMRD